MHPEDVAYHDIANAIIIQAVEDYRNALDGQSYNGYPPEVIIKRIEKFFRSRYFRILTTVDGEYIIARLKQEHSERNKNESHIDTSNT